MNKFIFTIAIIFAFLFLSCNKSNKEGKTITNNNDSIISSTAVEYAKNFTIKQNENYNILKVFNPWQGAKNVEYKYYLSNKKLENHSSNVIITPVKKVVCLSTTHVGFLDLLGKTNSIVGISGSNFIYNKAMQERIEKGEIVDVGYEQNLNIELIISLKPDVVFVYGVQANIVSKITELEKLGIKVVIVAEYLEVEPLGKAEWLKFFAQFYEQNEFAQTEFDTIAKKYNELTRLVVNSKNKPGILTNIPYQGVWYIPGGNSYFAKLISDAGGEFLWKQNNRKDSYPLGFEAIFLKQKQAKYLINPSSTNSINEILKIEPRLKNFECIKNKYIYNNNLRTKKNGANDFWESGVVKPDVILKDLITIFYPNSNKNKTLYYYKKIE